VGYVFKKFEVLYRFKLEPLFQNHPNHVCFQSYRL